MENQENKTVWDADRLRTRFSLALSEMYRKEVPLYGDLIQIVRDVDASVLQAQGKDLEHLPLRNHLERHGAIRLGSDEELRTIKRLFAVFGMHPVGYYDLRIVNFPLHATAFRPVTEETLARNPFRVFTSVLRKDLISPSIRNIVEQVLGKRNLFSPRLLELIQYVEMDKELYLQLKQEHPLIADIEEMMRRNVPAKERIEGPPARQCPILLRQTSFKALDEPVNFPTSSGNLVHGTHTARFGEVEQRGAAVTRKGRDMYDRLLKEALKSSTENSQGLDEAVRKAFSAYPDSWPELQREDLVYFRYRVSSSAPEHQKPHVPSVLKDLIASGLIEFEPLTYEDFLPLSAAGIFTSNLSHGHTYTSTGEGSLDGLSDLEAVLGCKVLDQFDLYHKLQLNSILQCAQALGLEEILIE